MSPGCDFCAIADGADSAVEIICQEPEWVAFFPQRPATPGHTLIIPRVHVTDLWHADPSLGAALASATIRVGQAITAALAPAGMNLITSAGTAAEQTVFHLHLHVVPRWPDDGFGRIWPGRERSTHANLGEVAEPIRAAYRGANAQAHDASC